MKKVLMICLTALTVMLILLLSIISCFAKGVLALDGISVGYNDTVTYTLYLADCEKPVTDMAAYLFYDSEYLELDRDSVDFHDLVGVNRNVNIDGYIPFNFSAISSPVDFSEKTPVISADFKVIKEGTSSIQYFVSELDCGASTDSSVVKEFTFTCDYVDHTVDGDEIAENKVPAILDNQEKINEYQGDFINYADGKGEQEKPGGNHIAVKGENNGIIDVTKDSDNNTTIIITAAVIVIILVIIILVILRKAFGSENDTEDSESEHDALEEPESEDD